VINVTKASGEKVPFDAGKIRHSLLRVKTAPVLIEQIIETVEREIYDGIPTSELFEIVYGELKKLRKGIAGKYNLKRAVMDLGPTGFPFEKFVGALWQTEGFSVATGQNVKGYCVNHEVDVIAEKENLHFMMECKYHSFQGKPCDVKHALYVNARFLDIEKKLKTAPNLSKKTHQGWLITNTRLTTDAVAYGTCVGLGLLSWDHPSGDSLRERIDRSGLHPVTCLTSLSAKEKGQLLERAIVLCRELLAKPEVLLEIGIGRNNIQEVLDEADAICGGI
jgi:hypothetical protein